MRLRLAAFLAAAVLPLAACGGDDDGSDATSREWDGPPAPDAQGRLAVDGFNEFLAANPGAASGSVAAAATFVGLDGASATSKSVTARTTGEGGGATTVTVTLDGLFDDSVRAQRFVLIFQPAEDGSWRLESAVATQRCHAGRGHEGFSAELCV